MLQLWEMHFRAFASDVTLQLCEQLRTRFGAQRAVNEITGGLCLCFALEEPKFLSGTLRLGTHPEICLCWTDLSCALPQTPSCCVGARVHVQWVLAAESRPGFGLDLSGHELGA